MMILGGGRRHPRFLWLHAPHPQVPVNRAAMIICCVSIPMGLGLIAYGIYGWTHEAPMYSMTLFIGIFSLFATWGVFKAARNGTVSDEKHILGSKAYSCSKLSFRTDLL